MMVYKQVSMVEREHMFSRGEMPRFRTIYTGDEVNRSSVLFPPFELTAIVVSSNLLPLPATDTLVRVHNSIEPQSCVVGWIMQLTRRIKR